MPGTDVLALATLTVMLSETPLPFATVTPLPPMTVRAVVTFSAVRMTMPFAPGSASPPPPPPPVAANVIVFAVAFVLVRFLGANAVQTQEAQRKGDVG